MRLRYRLRRAPEEHYRSTRPIRRDLVGDGCFFVRLLRAFALPSSQQSGILLRERVCPHCDSWRISSSLSTEPWGISCLP